MLANDYVVKIKKWKDAMESTTSREVKPIYSLRVNDSSVIGLVTRVVSRGTSACAYVETHISITSRYSREGEAGLIGRVRRDMS
jgi:hypothetical protein